MSLSRTLTHGPAPVAGEPAINVACNECEDVSVSRSCHSICKNRTSKIMNKKRRGVSKLRRTGLKCFYDVYWICFNAHPVFLIWLCSCATMPCQVRAALIHSLRLVPKDINCKCYSQIIILKWIVNAIPQLLFWNRIGYSIYSFQLDWFQRLKF